MPETSDALDALRSYARVWLQLTGAGSVSVYVPAPSGPEHDVLVHEGTLPPLPELVDLAAAAGLHGRLHVAATAPVRLPSGLAEGVLYRVPLRWVLEGAPRGVERRRSAVHAEASPEAIWLGLRFEAAPGEAALDAAALNEQALRAFLGLGAAVAMHTRAARRAQLDPVTGLPERREFQQELDSALAHAADSGRSLVLLLLGPDDFGWVNERLDRRSGDRVLHEIAARLRSAVRRHDHVARYGGAMFTVVLRDATLEDGRVVAANVLQRLGEEPYHRRLFRLEFSAGVAGWDGDALVDAQELVRRADQALSAAKRGLSGHVRVWEKGSDVETARSLDRLQGIFTGEKAKDYRNMRLLLDTVAAVAGSTDPAHLARSFTERLSEALHARRALVVQRVAGGGLEILAGCDRRPGTTGPLQIAAPDRQLLERAGVARDLVTEDRPEGAILCALPLCLEDRSLGGILLEASSDDLSIESSDRLFLDALASEMAVALDRARLAERERQHEREEKEQLEAEVHDLRRVMQGSRLTYASPQMESLLATARKVARTDTTVLITGESGTGKELLAHVLHQLSTRHERAMVVVDCSAISPTLIESELFGHEKGAFTGAHARNPGRLAQAHGSTVFLDEIGELPLDLQGKLLRFVQEKQFTPVGGVGPRVVDVRIVAATNVELQQRVAQGRFREDLYHRLNVVRLRVPPLRERRDDILQLADAFLKQFAALYRRPAQRFTPAAQQAMLEHPWPGNVRELQNVVLTSVLFADGADIDARELHLHGAPSAPAAAAPEQAGRAPSDDVSALLREALAREIADAIASRAPVPLGRWLDEDIVLAADRLSDGVHRRGSEVLGIPETTYRRQLHSALQRRAGGLRVRTATWTRVESLLDDVIRSRPDRTDACGWAEGCLLAELTAALPGNVRLTATLLGVTEPTVLRRLEKLRRS